MKNGHGWIVVLLLLPHHALGRDDGTSRLDDSPWMQAAAATEGGSNMNPSGEVEKERGEGPSTVFLELNGVRYEAIHWGKAQGLEQNGGYLAAIDEKTGKRKWLVRVYKIQYKPDMEEDKQDVFISKISQGLRARTLLIENDRNEYFILDLRNHSVKGPMLR